MPLKKKLGKRPYEADERDLTLGSILAPSAPAAALGWGHYALVDGNLYDFDFPWGMLANDKVGDCVFAGAAHSQMLDDAEGGRPQPSFSEKAVLADYSAVTGYQAGKPSTDKGTVVRDALKFRRKTGIGDSHGKRHRIGLFAAVDFRDHGELDAIGATLGKIGIGFEVPAYAMAQFDAGEIWDVDESADGTIDGGHFVVVVGKLASNYVVSTWGTLAMMTPRFFDRYVDEAWAYVTGAQINPESGETLAGLDVEKARAYVAGLEKE